MYLKSIEIQGFKSFANKLRFEFHNGITAIVGPNGSGKSNVSDAVRWVLGEQKTSQLRSNKMEDVIFAGTEHRKPLGFAFVAITLDNEDKTLPVDYETVTVSRRLFRSGESEYMINGSAVRLKDIHQIFFDTGIGKDGYSIIGQGQIDKILSGKPEERRELFDEAAGIVKYKYRKTEALKKLNDEKQNLLRVEDIIKELEKQIGPLKIQSEKAKEYLQYREKLKQADIKMFIDNANDIKIKTKALDTNLLIVSNDIESTNLEFNTIKQEYEKLDIVIEKLNSTIDITKEQLNNSILQKEKYENHINILKEQIKAVQSKDNIFSNQINSLNKNLESKLVEVDSLKNEKLELENKLSEVVSISGDLDSLVTSISEETKNIKEELEILQNELLNTLNESGIVRSKSERHNVLMDEIIKRQNVIEEQLKKYDSERNDNKDKLDKLENQALDVKNIISSLNKRCKSINENIMELQNKKEIIEKQIENLQIDFHKLKSKLESLKNMTERYEGYGNSVKKIMEQKKSMKGIIGVVADIIKVDKKYETAIETALGGSIQNIVTDTEDSAKKLIEFLKYNKFGRSTFLPLSAITNKAFLNNANILKENGVLGLASSLVNVDEKYKSISSYLLGKTIVVDNIDNGVFIARKYKYTIRIVTLDGEQLNPGGSISGGAYRNTSNLLGRYREIEELESLINKTSFDKIECEKKLDVNNSKINTLEEELDNNKEELTKNYLLQNSIKINYDQLKEKEYEIQNNAQNSKRENELIIKQLEDINVKKERFLKEIEENSVKHTKLEETISILTQELNEKEQLFKIKNEDSQKAKIEINHYKSKHMYLENNLNRLEEENNDLKSQINVMANSSSKSNLEISEKQTEINALISKITELNKLISDKKINMENDLLSKEKMISEHKEFFTKREELSEKAINLDKELFRLNSTKEKLEENYDNIVNYMWNEYEITYSAAQNQYEELNMDTNELKKAISMYKTKIKNLGDINVNAIEEYKNVGERYEFLTTQHSDLIESKEKLIGIVEELDIGMKKQFNEKFTLIKEEFDKVFKELFGGGNGEILLEDESNILESGIKIISQPPGKKLQNMMQMSGGEKALTAISLLFAIQNLKPSPFCLLDEIEAALDGSNVVRFANYLHKLTVNTQFIVITHRRGTMNCADILYGITMQEKGVSTLVSVNLLENELEK